jgi:RNA polymerase sigma factor (TIGR02999 family)
LLLLFEDRKGIRTVLTVGVSIMESGSSGQVTLLLHRMRNGDPQAAERLLPLVLHELRALARHYLKGERPDHTSQPTALVNEAYLRLVGDQARDWKNRAHFVGVTTSIMRRILIDYARRRQALKRGAGEQGSELRRGSDALGSEQAEELIALNLALDRLDKMNPDSGRWWSCAISAGFHSRRRPRLSASP